MSFYKVAFTRFRHYLKTIPTSLVRHFSRLYRSSKVVHLSETFSRKKKNTTFFCSTKNSSLLDLGVRPTKSITTGVLRLHLHQGDHVIGHGDHDDVGHGDHDPIYQEGGDGAGEAGGEVVQHPRFEPRRDEKPRGEDRSRQPGRSGRCKHLHREPDQDGRWFEQEQPTTTTMLDNNQQPGWVERSEKPNPGRTQCRQVMIGDDRC